jgi:crossover junction endodeoxyribonuclease RuvC
MGIDPGSRATGYAFIEVNSTSAAPRLVECGAVRVPPGRSHALRLRAIFEKIQALLQKHRPAEVAVEAVFHAKNARAALLLGQARGAALAAVGERGVSVFEYSPLSIKKTVAGYGRAPKEQVQRMVQALLSLHDAPAAGEEAPRRTGARMSADASDAAAVALCHAAHRAARTQGLIS